MKAVILAVSLFLPLSFTVASAQPTKITVGYSSIAAGQLPASVAKEAGIFAKNGLDVQLVYLRAGTTATMALLSRQTPISQLAGPAIVGASLRGADTVMIAGGFVITEWWLMTRPEIKTAEQLKGGSAAIALFGGLGDFYDPHRPKKARTDCGEGCRIPADRRSARTPECLGDGKGSSRYAPPTRQLHGAEKGFL